MTAGSARHSIPAIGRWLVRRLAVALSSLLLLAAPLAVEPRQLTVALHCYDLYGYDGTWRGVAFVNEDEWQFEVFDAQGRRTDSGAADAFQLVLQRLGLVEKNRACTSVFVPCFGKATRC